MENRKPFQLRKVLIVYNLFQTLFSAWIFYEVSEHTYLMNEILALKYLTLKHLAKNLLRSILRAIISVPKYGFHYY